MKFSLRTLLAILLLAAVVIAVLVSRRAAVHLKLGMEDSRVESLLRSVGAKDISDGMSTYYVLEYAAGGPPSEYYTDPGVNPVRMWHLPSIGLTIETEYDDAKLARINVWDWTGRQLNDYHHALEYDSVSELIIPVLHNSYRCEVLETHNQGVNPPANSGG